MYEHVKNKLQESGELMIQMADGKTFELHLHNVSFQDDAKLIEINAGAETYWLNGEEVVYMWIHREGP